MKFEHADESLKMRFFKMSRPAEFNSLFKCCGGFKNVSLRTLSYEVR